MIFLEFVIQEQQLNKRTKICKPINENSEQSMFIKFSILFLLLFIFFDDGFNGHFGNETVLFYPLA